MDYSLILSTNYAGKAWVLSGNSYEGLDWQDASPKPTQEQLDALWQSTQETVAKDYCKSQAIALLAATDWAVLPDVGLANQADFVFYRLNLRNLVRNPVANPVFGTEPTPVWS